MAPRSSAPAHTPDRTLRISRHFDAPPALLFRLWASPEHRVRWWGPEGYGLSTCEMDFRVGGAWRIGMMNASHDVHKVHGRFTEIVEPTRLCFTYVNDQDGVEMLVEMDFAAEGAGTRMEFVQGPFISVEERDAHDFGWTSTFALLNRYATKIGPDAAPVGVPRQPGDM